MRAKLPVAWKLAESIAATANDVTGAVRNVTSTLTVVETIVDKYNVQGLENGTINSTVTGLNNQADSITRKVNDNARTLTNLINGM